MGNGAVKRTQPRTSQMEREFRRSHVRLGGPNQLRKPEWVVAENTKHIAKKRDLAEIIHFGDPEALETFLDDPIPVIAQATLELFSHGPIALAGPAVRGWRIRCALCNVCDTQD